MSRYFIAATGTDIGKTMITTAICWQWRQKGGRVNALKPVMTGYDASNQLHDAALLLQAAGREVTTDNIIDIAPWRFAAPLSPHMTAEMEKRPLHAERIATFCRSHEVVDHLLLVESAGGIMTPIGAQETMLDIAAMLRYRIVLVVGTYLGSLSHTLTALEAMKARSLTLSGVIINESGDSSVPLQSVCDTLRAHLSVPLISVPRLALSGKPWKQVPDLLSVLT